MAQNFLSDIKLGDSIYIRLGDRTSGDLNLYHNGTNSFIDNHTGNVYIRNFSDDKNIHLQSDDGSGGMTDYIVVHGSENIVKFQEHSRHLDNKEARFGTGSDLKIYHESATGHSHIKEAGTGELRLSANIFRVLNANTSETMIYAEQDGKVQLRYNESAKLETTSAGVTVTGSISSGDITSTHTGGGTINLRRDDTTISGTNTLGAILFQGDDPTDGTFNSGAAIFGTANGSWASGSYPGQLEFKTRNTSGSLTTALTLNKDQSATFAGNITVGDGHFIGDDSFDNLLLQSSTGENLNLSAANDIIFFTGGTAPNALGTQRLRIFNSDGSATFAGAVTINGAGAASYGGLNLVSSDSFIRLNSTGGTTDKQKWDIRAVSASGYEALDFRTVNDANDSFSTKLSIAHGGTATFAGDVKLADNKKIKGTTYSAGFISFESDGETRISANDDVVIGYLETLNISNAGVSTFAGTVKAYGNSDTTPAFEMYSDSNHGMRILHRGTDGDFSFERRLNGTNTEFLRIGRANGNATFEGTITTTSTATGAITLNGGTGVATTGAFVLRQNGDQVGNGMAITSSHATSHRIWKDASGNLNIGPSSDGDAFIQDLSGNITIAGDVDVDGGELKISGDFAKLFFVDTASNQQDAYIVNNANGLFFGKTNSPSASNDILSLDLSNSSATFAGEGIFNGGLVNVNGTTNSVIAINANTHNTNVANEASLNFSYAHSGGGGVGFIRLTEDANNSFGADMTFGVPHNNGSGSSTTRTALTLDGGTLKATFVGNIQTDFQLLGRGFRGANRGELHLNGTGTDDVAEIFFGHGSGYTEGNIRWAISDRGTTDGNLKFFRGPANGGFQEQLTLHKNGLATFQGGVKVDNGDLILGEDAFSVSADYVGMKTSHQSGTNDYMIISGTSDGSTYVSSKSGSTTYIRAGGNHNTHQLSISSTGAVFSGDLQVNGNLNIVGNSSVVNVEDINVEANEITLNYNASSDTSSSAGGAGIRIQDAVDANNDATILWDETNDEFDFSHGITVLGDINASGAITLAGTLTNNVAQANASPGNTVTLTKINSNNAYTEYTGFLGWTYSGTGSNPYTFNLVFEAATLDVAYEVVLRTGRNGNWRNFGAMKDFGYIYNENDGDFKHNAEGDVSIASSLGTARFSLDSDPVGFGATADNQTSDPGTGGGNYTRFIRRYSFNFENNTTGSDGQWEIYVKAYNFAGNIKFLNA